MGCGAVVSGMKVTDQSGMRTVTALMVWLQDTIYGSETRFILLICYREQHPALFEAVRYGTRVLICG